VISKLPLIADGSNWYTVPGIALEMPLTVNCLNRGGKRIVTNKFSMITLIISLCITTAAAARDMISSDDNVYFQLSASERQRLVEGVKKLKLGDSLSRAHQLLGEPSMEEIGGGKKLGSDEYIWTTYYVYRKSRSINVGDLRILLQSTMSGEIIFIFSNLDEYIRDEHKSSKGH
jgi:hypothetical protein